MRTVQAVGIPVFQFGIFSQTDLSYFPGPVFNFGGRIHTNGNLWLASGNSLTLADKVTAVGDILVGNLANGYATYWNPGSSNLQTPQTDTCQAGWSGTAPSTSNPYPGQIMVSTIPYSSCLQLEQGSVTGNSVTGAISTTVNSNWYSLSTGTYNSDILGGKAEAVPSLNLSVVAPAVGGTPIDLVRRPISGENPLLTAERYYTLSSVNILLDDTSALLTGTSGACGTPINLATLAVDSSGEYTSYPSWYTGGAEGKLPLPTSAAESSASYSANDGYWIKPHYPIIQGWILINLHTNAGACTDVTKEILNLGFIGRNLNNTVNTSKVSNTSSLTLNALGASLGASTCPDPSSNAVIRLARLRDNPSSIYSGSVACGWPYKSGSPLPTDFWPNVLFDTREAISRDVAPPTQGALSPNGNLTAAGVMNYVELDVANLDLWFTGKIGSTGSTANNATGYTVYFSDRRGEGNDPGLGYKTGAYGFNDVVNPSDTASGCPNNSLDTGEDLEQNGTLYTYGKTENPLTLDTSSSGDVIGGGTTPPSGTMLSNNSDGTCSALGTAWPGAEYAQYADARVNPPLFFRHALKVVDGGSKPGTAGALAIGTCNTVPCGLTIASESAVYLQGDFNSPTNGAYVTSASSPGTSIAADAVILLSDSWNDANSFWWPYSPGNRPGAGGTTYRVAIIAGKGVQFPQVAGTGQDYGTDGGVHNFLRYLEGWGGTLYYQGSIVSFYYNQQNVGLYKCCTTVYGPPTRNYIFDTNFNTPSLLPPNTPMLRDVNNTGFTQVVSPSQ